MVGEGNVRIRIVDFGLIVGPLGLVDRRYYLKRTSDVMRFVNVNGSETEHWD